MEVNMKQSAKKILVSFGVLSLTMVGGCGSTSEKQQLKKEEVKETKSEVKMVANDVYLAPLNPSTPQIEAYNKLSEAISTNNRQEEATMVAVNFAFDFFTLSNKKDVADIGGLQFIPTNKIRDYMEFAKSYYYGNYPAIVNEYGKNSLPQVTAYTVDSVEKSQFTYGKSSVEGFFVKLTLSYADTKVKELKEKLTIAVIQLQDFQYDRTKDYKKEVIYPGQMNTVYRILSVE